MLSIDLPRAYPFADPRLPFSIDAMRLHDVEHIMPIEHEAFSSPWPASAYRYELTKNKLSAYLVMRWRRKAAASVVPPLVAYGGLWMILDEGHISTLAVHAEWQGQSLGQAMLVALIDTAIAAGACEVTLEVRASNIVAQHLYRKYGFHQVGIRKRYYRDNNEDALIMTTPRIENGSFLAQHTQRKHELEGRQVARWPPALE
jgi:ribosomal-protein-alanine N-acetyltransferase